MREKAAGTDPSGDEASDLRDRFHDDFGDRGDFAADVLRDCLSASHRFIAQIVGSVAADAGFDAMVSEFFERDVRESGWRGALIENDGMLYSEFPMGQVFHDLTAYAYLGIALNGGETADERHRLLGELIERAEHFYGSIPFKLWSIQGKDLKRTMLLARGRWALDNGEPIEAPALAIFGGVTERRIRNMMSKTERLFANAGGRVPAKDALDWLKHRPTSFRPSIWRAQQAFDDLAEAPRETLDDVLFVPVGQDGTMFHPGLARDERYRLGGEEDDLIAEDFGEALEILQKMITPVWRRPTRHGLWTRVQGVGWERMTRDELDRIGEAPTPD